LSLISKPWLPPSRAGERHAPFIACLLRPAIAAQATSAFYACLRRVDGSENGTQASRFFDREMTVVVLAIGEPATGEQRDHRSERRVRTDRHDHLVPVPRVRVEVDDHRVERPCEER
jgi:hypothetical protein